MSQASFQKQQREKARRERNAAKEAKRAERGAATEAEAEAEPLAPPTDQGVVLAELAELHERFEAGQLNFDDFEVAKERLMEQLDVR